MNTDLRKTRLVTTFAVRSTSQPHIYTKHDVVEINIQPIGNKATTYQEAVNNTETVIAKWLETAQVPGRAIPEPAGRFMYA